jgi:hypothetical protein
MNEQEIKKYNERVRKYNEAMKDWQIRYVVERWPELTRWTKFRIFAVLLPGAIRRWLEELPARWASWQL